MVSATADVGTYTDGDSLVGGLGTDTLSVVIADSASNVTQPTIFTDGIEVLSVTNNNDVATTLSAAQFVGLQSVKVTGGLNNLTVSGSTKVLNAELVSTNNSLTITAATAATLGAADSAEIALNGVATTANVTVTNDGVEKFTVGLNGSASGSATNGTAVTLASNELETVVVTGSAAARLVADLTGADDATQTAVFDASAATGNITATITKGGSGKLSVTGGSGDDVLTVGTITKEMTVEGGAGVDTLVTSGAYSSTVTTQAGANVSGFEKVSGSIDQRAFTKNTFVESVNAGTYEYLAATFTTANISTNGIVTIDRATDTDADSLTVNLSATTSGTSTITASEEEKIAINAGGLVSGVTHTVALSSADLTELTVTGSNSLNLGALDSLVVKSIDASALTGVTFTVDASASNVAMTIKGSAGVPTTEGNTVNTLTGGSKGDNITGGAYKDIINGGLGADTISGGAGNDVIDGGSGSDVIDAGDGNNSVVGGSGDDSITAGSGNDTIDAGTGDDTIVAGAGNDMIIEAALTDDTNIDGGTGTDRLAAVNATATTFNSTAASLETGFVSVTDDAAPTVAGVETAYVSIDASSSASADDPVDLDLTDASTITTLYLEIAGGEGDFAKVTNYKGSSITLFGATTNAEEADVLTIDGAGQASLTLNLEAYIGADGDEDLVVTGVDAFTLAGKSKSMFTGTASQDNLIDALTANSVSSLTISSSGSNNTADGAAALTIGAVSAAAANVVGITAGAADVVTITSVTTSGDDVESATVTVGADAILDINALNFDGSALDTLTISVSDAGTLSSGANNVVAHSEMVDVTADSIDSLSVTLAAGSTEASLDLSGIEVTSSTFSLASASTLVLKGSLGSAGDVSSFVFSGRGDLDFDTGAGAINNTVALVGAGVTFDTSGLTVDDDALTVTGTASADVIKTGLGADVITGGNGNDTIDGGAGDDLITGGAGNDNLTGGLGADDFRITAAADGADTINFSITQGDQILFDVDNEAGTSDLFDAGAAIFANTNPTNVAGTIVVLNAGDYNEAAAGALNFADNKVNVITTTGYASAVAALTANGGGDGEAGILVFYNTTTSKVEMYYTADADSTTASDHTLLATLNGLALTDIPALSAANFGVFSLG